MTNFVRQHPNVYEVAVDVSARQPGAAWAEGVDVGYVTNGQTQVIRLYFGLAIGAGGHLIAVNGDDPLCARATSAVQAEFEPLPGG